MPAPDEVTLGEVFRSVEAMRGDVKALGAQVAERPDWQDVRRIEAGWADKLTAETTARVAAVAAEAKTRAAEHATASRAIKALEDWNKWALRTAGGAVILAAAGWALSGGLVP